MEERIKTALAALGDTPDAIAASLAGRGIVGDQCKTASCPIAVYLARACEIDPRQIIVDLSSIDVYQTADADGYYGPCEVIRTPRCVREFVRSFDDGNYPALATRGTGPAAVIACH